MLGAGTAQSASCEASGEVWGALPQLVHSREALRARSALKIVAMGSSSTQGIGASAVGLSYPAQLAAILAARFPDRRIQIANRGIGGDTVARNLARLERDVLAERPDLVIWQVGTNDALMGVPAAEVRAQILDGIARIRGAGAEVLLMDSQPLPDPEREARVIEIGAVIMDAARDTGVAFVSRHDLMAYWLRAGQFTAAELIGADGLHMTDASYRCLAERLADLFPSEAAPAAAAGLVPVSAAAP
jgi:acyl-CoA thioesterase-1